MLTSLWSSIGGKLSDRFVALSAPALVFWLGGLLAWSYAHGGIHALSVPAAWLGKRSTLIQVVALLAILSGVTASGLLIDRITLPVLRLLEGYWPAWPPQIDWLRNSLITRLQDKAAAELKPWNKLMQEAQPRTADQLATIGRLDLARYRRPADPKQFMPTAIGNILRASELRPISKYGLDPVATWPRLWLVLPDNARLEVTAARKALDSSVAAIIWGILFCAFTPWTILALPVGLAVAGFAVIMWVPTRAQDYGDMVEATYDMHRTIFYQQLRWPLSVNPQQEQTQGRLITEYLQVGLDGLTPRFTPQSPARRTATPRSRG